MKSAPFSQPLLALALVLPQATLLAVFCYWPAVETVRASFMADGAAFGLHAYRETLGSPAFRAAAWFTAWFTPAVALISLAIAMPLAAAATRVLRAATTWKTLIVWVYAVAPAAAGLIGVLVFSVETSPFIDLTRMAGWDLPPAAAITIVSVWKLIPLDFVCLVAALHAVPPPVVEAATLDCPSRRRRSLTITLPLIAPTCAGLVAVNVAFALFDTLALIDTMTAGGTSGPATLVYQAFLDGIAGGHAAAAAVRSVILIAFVLALAIIPWRMIARRPRLA